MMEMNFKAAARNTKVISSVVLFSFVTLATGIVMILNSEFMLDCIVASYTKQPRPRIATVDWAGWGQVLTVIGILGLLAAGSMLRYRVKTRRAVKAKSGSQTL